MITSLLIFYSTMVNKLDVYLLTSDVFCFVNLFFFFSVFTDSSSVKGKHVKYDTEMVLDSSYSMCDSWVMRGFKYLHESFCWFQMDGKNNLTCEEPEEIPSPKLTDWLKSSTPWRSPVRHGSLMMPSTPLAWRFDSDEFTLKEDLF